MPKRELERWKGKESRQDTREYSEHERSSGAPRANRKDVQLANSFLSLILNLSCFNVWRLRFRADLQLNNMINYHAQSLLRVQSLAVVSAGHDCMW